MRREAVNAQEIYSWDDYMSWPEEERWELIRGEVFDMSPAPTRFHQFYLAEILRQLANALEGKPCKVVTAPFDVKLSSDEEDAFPTVLQPDLVINCSDEKWMKTGMRGAPDLVLEILSPRTALRDRKVKFDLYAASGVREYWILSPEEKTLEVYVQEEAAPQGAFRRHAVWGEEDSFSLTILPEIELDLKKVFSQ